MNEFKCYKVGGCVRDSLLGLEPRDIDYVVVGASEKEMLERGYRRVGMSFPVFLHPETGDEYALARTERKTGKGYKGFSVEIQNVSLEEDLLRRDLTINAMAQDPETGEVIDPYGGQDDLKNKILRHTSEAFAEDPLRILRVARFLARYPDFTVAEETEKLCRNLVEELSEIHRFRFYLELKKALMEEKPSRYFRFLKKIGALEHVDILLWMMEQTPHTPKHHAEGNVFEHTMFALDFSRPVLEERYAVLYHDMGKPLSFRKYKNFYSHCDYEIVRVAVGFLRKMGHENHLVNLAAKVAEHHCFVHAHKEARLSRWVRRFMLRSFPKRKEEFEILLNASRADSRAKIFGTRNLTLEEAQKIFDGGDMEGFSLVPDPDYTKLKKTFDAFLSLKVHLPEKYKGRDPKFIKEKLFDLTYRGVVENLYS